ncbi:hypothetical protein Tco_0286821 [Tanacetum coccineum]
MTCSHTNFSACLSFAMVRGFASTHLVECSIAMARNFRHPGAVGCLASKSPFTWLTIKWESTKMVRLLISISSAIRKLASNYSYSASSFVVSNLNRRVYVHSFPSGLFSINPALVLSELEAPVKEGEGDPCVDLSIISFRFGLLLGQFACHCTTVVASPPPSCSTIGEKFIAKQVDKRKKKKLEKDEHKMVGWGKLLKHSSFL